MRLQRTICVNKTELSTMHENLCKRSLKPVRGFKYNARVGCAPRLLSALPPFPLRAEHSSTFNARIGCAPECKKITKKSIWIKNCQSCRKFYIDILGVFFFLFDETSKIRFPGQLNVHDFDF